MRIPNREINIFNLSMLDVISGAMAAFLILLVVLLPYYRKEHIDYQAIIANLQAQLTEARDAAAQAQAQAAQAQADAAQAAQAAEQARAEAEGLRRQLAKTFLVLYIRWNSSDDVDLHLIDPSGAEFYFEAKTIPGRQGELSEDTTRGPGNEVWEIRDAAPGDYRVRVTLYRDDGNPKPILIQGRVFHRDGSAAFPAARLITARAMVDVATITVAADGSVSVR